MQNINKDFPGLIRFEDPRCGPNYIIKSEIECKGILNIDLDLPLIVVGNVRATGGIYSNTTLKCGGELQTNGDLKVKGDVQILFVEGDYSPKVITVGKDMIVDGYVFTSGSITVGSSLVVSDWIGTMDGDIIVGGGIRSGGRIMTPGVIDCKKRIFAGLQPNATSKRCDKTIMCKELKNGEHNTDMYVIFFGDRYAYKVFNASEEFIKDLSECNLAPLSRCSARY